MRTHIRPSPPKYLRHDKLNFTLTQPASFAIQSPFAFTFTPWIDGHPFMPSRSMATHALRSGTVKSGRGFKHCRASVAAPLRPSSPREGIQCVCLTLTDTGPFLQQSYTTPAFTISTATCEIHTARNLFGRSDTYQGVIPSTRTAATVEVPRENQRLVQVF